MYCVGTCSFKLAIHVAMNVRPLKKAGRGEQQPEWCKHRAEPLTLSIGRSVPLLALLKSSRAKASETDFF